MRKNFIPLDLPYFIKGGAFLNISQTALLFINFLLSIVLSRNLSAETYGVYRYLFSIVTVLGIFTLSGLGTAVAVACAQGNPGTLRFACRKQFLASLGMGAVSLVLGLIALSRQNFTFFFFFASFALASPFIFSASLYEHCLTGLGKFSRLSIFSTASTALPSVFLLLTALFAPEQFLRLLPFYFLLQAAATCFFYRLTSLNIPRNAPVDKEAFPFGLKLSLLNILNTVADQADSLITFWLLGPSALAVYSFAVMIPEVIKGQFKTLALLAVPKLGTIPRPLVARKMPFYLLAIAAAGALCAVVYIAAVPFLFRLFFPRYLEAVPYSQIFALSLAFFPTILLTTAFQVDKKIRSLYAFNIFSSVFQLLIFVPAILLGGLWGLIFARILARTGSLLLGIFLYKRTSA